MTRHRWHDTLPRNIMMLMIFPICMVAVTYALFSQNLSINGATSSVAYVSNQSLMMTYAKTQTGTSPYTYTIGMTLKNGSTTNTTVWQVDFTVPPDTSTITCPATVTCTLNGTTLTILSNTNGAIAKNGGSIVVSFSFKTATTAYTLQDVATYANYNITYATKVGLTVNVSVGARTGSSGAYTWPVTVTITNDFSQPLGGWRVAIKPWESTYVKSGLPAGVTASGTTTLTLTGANELATGAVYQFTWLANTKTTATWSITSATVTGRS